MIVFGDVIGSPAGSSQNSSALIFSITAADLIEPYSGAPGGFAARLEVRNHPSFIPTVTVVLLKSL